MPDAYDVFLKSLNEVDRDRLFRILNDIVTDGSVVAVKFMSQTIHQLSVEIDRDNQKLAPFRAQAEEIRRLIASVEQSGASLSGNGVVDLMHATLDSIERRLADPVMKDRLVRRARLQRALEGIEMRASKAQRILNDIKAARQDDQTVRPAAGG